MTVTNENVTETFYELEKYLKGCGIELLMRKAHEESPERQKEREMMEKEYGKTIIKSLRESLGYKTISSLARAMNIPTSIIKDVENDEISHSYMDLLLFADFFHMDVEALTQCKTSANT